MKNVPIVVNPKSSFNTRPGFFHEIWFRLPGSTGALSVKVQAVSVDYPQSVWDNLSENFEMISARP